MCVITLRLFRNSVCEGVCVVVVVTSISSSAQQMNESYFDIPGFSVYMKQ